MSTTTRTEHLLLATLGRAPGAVLGTLDWLNNPDPWSRLGRVPAPVSAGISPTNAPPPVTHLWVITTNDEVAKRGLETLIAPILETPPDGSGLGGISPRLRFVDISDITSLDDHQAMAEILYRLVLQGASWQQAGEDRRFSVSLSGGRKTMSAVLQQAATFLPVDWVFHLVFDERSGIRANTWDDVQQHRNLHFPVSISSTRTPWYELLAHAWQQLHGSRLTTEEFPLSDDWTEETANCDVTSVGLAGNPRQQLSLRLQDVAGHTHQFAVQGLACGVGPSFLRHDLRPLVLSVKEQLTASPDGLSGTQMQSVSSQINALERYLQGLECVLQVDRQRHQPEPIPVSNLPNLLSQAWILAAGTPVAPTISATGSHHWSQKDFEMELQTGDVANNLVLRGISETALLLVLRNLVANARTHGRSAAERPRLLVTLKQTSAAGDDQTEAVSLGFQNAVDENAADGLCERAGPDGRLLWLLQPFQQGCQRGPGRVRARPGQGLGLFTVARVLMSTNPKVRLQGPRLEPRADSPLEAVDFAVGLEFCAEGK